MVTGSGSTTAKPTGSSSVTASAETRTSSTASAGGVGEAVPPIAGGVMIGIIAALAAFL
jgi:hypothetical protein